jgi:hypothetical protein
MNVPCRYLCGGDWSSVKHHFGYDSENVAAWMALAQQASDCSIIVSEKVTADDDDDEEAGGSAVGRCGEALPLRVAFSC